MGLLVAASLVRPRRWSWSIGFVLSSAAYALLYNDIGWRGLLWMGILPALADVWVRKYVKEPEVWVENRRKQRETSQEVRAPLFAIFKPKVLLNTLTSCWWMASGFVVYYSIWSLFATPLQRDLHLGALMVGAPLIVANLVAFLASGFWGWLADIIGRRWSMMIPAFIGIFVTPVYLLTTDPLWTILGFIRRVSSPGRSTARTQLPGRTLPDRSAFDRQRLLLPPGGDLWRVRGPSPDVLRHQHRHRVRHSDAGRDNGRPRQLHPFCVGWPGNQEQGTGCRSRGFRDRGNSLIASSLSPFNGAAS
jgi:MFS family permease